MRLPVTSTTILALTNLSTLDDARSNGGHTRHLGLVPPAHHSPHDTRDLLVAQPMPRNAAEPRKPSLTHLIHDRTDSVTDPWYVALQLRMNVKVLLLERFDLVDDTCCLQ